MWFRTHWTLDTRDQTKSTPKLNKSKLGVIESACDRWFQFGLLFIGTIEIGKTHARESKQIRVRPIGLLNERQTSISCDPLCNWSIIISNRYFCMRTVCAQSISRSMTKRQFTIHPSEDTSDFCWFFFFVCSKSEVTYFVRSTSRSNTCYVSMRRWAEKSSVNAEIRSSTLPLNLTRCSMLHNNFREENEWRKAKNDEW